MDDHTQQVSGIDWNDKTNQIISCAHDKNAIVYTYVDTKWRPDLVVMPNQTRASLCVKWNKKGDMFAVGSGNKRIFLGYYEASNAWWTCLTFKVHESSVIALSFHPTRPILASTSTDKKVIISSAYIEGVDPTEDASTTKVLLISTF